MRKSWLRAANIPFRSGAMRELAGTRVEVTLAFDPSLRVEPMPLALRHALATNTAAQAAYDALTPSRRKEMLRYLNSLKTERSIERTVQQVINQLLEHPITS